MQLRPRTMRGMFTGIANTLLNTGSRHARSLLALALFAALWFGAGSVNAEGAKDAPPPPPAPLDLSLPRDAAAASAPFKPKTDGRNAGRPYGSGYEARGLGSAKADAASTPAGAASAERDAPGQGMTVSGPGTGARGGGHRAGRPGGGGRR